MADGKGMPGGDGSDGSNDICSFLGALLNQRDSMERLLNWLRQSQTTCTDSICSDDLTNPLGIGRDPLRSSGGGSGDDGGGFLESNALGMVVWFIVTVLTFYVMNLSRNRDQDKAGPFNRPHRDDHDDQGLRRNNNNNNDDDDSNRPSV